MRYHQSLICALILVSLSTPAYADLIAYEGFDYANVGGELLGTDGGIGFRGPWVRDSARPQGISQSLNIASRSLSFQGLKTDGNRIRTGAVSPYAILGRDLATGIGQEETRTMYLSFLLRPESPFVSFFGVPLGDAGQDGIGQGVQENMIFIGGTTTSTRGTYDIENLAGALNHSSNVPVVVDQTAFLVVKAELTPRRDTFTLYVNPIPGEPEPLTGTVKNDFDIRNITSLAFAGDSAFSVNEIRLGDTFADVTPGFPLTAVEFIARGEQWNFFPGRAEPSSFPDLAWTTSGFDDSQWGTSQEGFGYGVDAQSRNVVTVFDDMQGNYSSVYLRHAFHVQDPDAVSKLALEVDYDDAFIAYINGVEVARSSNVGTPGTPEPVDANSRSRQGTEPVQFYIDLSSLRGILQAGDNNILAIQGLNRRSADGDFVLSQIKLLGLLPELTMLQAGDADQDLDFDQLDLVQVQIAAKYLSGQPATWGQGDWNGAPGGTQGSPPAGDGMFNQLDIVAAQQAGKYLTGLYAAVRPNGRAGDGQTSVVYNPATGALAVDAPAGTNLTSINIDSAAGIFTGSVAQNLGGSFDNDADNNIFKATFGSSFGSLSFGNVAQSGLDQQFLLSDLTVVGSLAGGGALGDVDLIYVPEPSTVLLVAMGMLVLLAWGCEKRRT